MALPLWAVKSIERPARFTGVPFAASWLRGVTAIHGEILSVVDLARFAGLEDAGRAPGARLLVTEASGVTSALLVDRVAHITGFPDQLTTVPGSSPMAAYCRGGHDVNGEVVPALDPHLLLTSAEFASCQV